MKHKQFNFIFAILLAMTLGGCGMFSSLDRVVPDNTKKYLKAETMSPLDVPPDLSTERINDDVAHTKSVATYLEFEEAATNPLASKYNIDPDTKPMLSGEGKNRHLIVPNDLATTWQRVLTFWQQKGLGIKRQEMRIGLMDTYPEQDGYAYRVRIEKGDVLTRTNVYIKGANSNKVMAQKDEIVLRQLAEFLGRLHQADKAQYQKQAQTNKKQTSQKIVPKLVEESNGYHFVHVDRDFFDVWQRVGRVLDSKGFVVEDRDRSQGVYLIKYVDPEQEEIEETGILDKLMFWKDDAEVTPEVFYHIKLISEADDTKMIILDAKKERLNSATAKKLLVLMQEQLAQ